MRILFVASECVPLVKTGGLADVAGALPKALTRKGVDVRVLVPGYTGVMARMAEGKVVWRADDVFSRQAVVRRAPVDGLDVLALDIPEFYERDGLYVTRDGADWPDNPVRFASLAWVAASIARDGLEGGWRPDIVHAHDWQAALAPLYLKDWGVPDVASILTIHNMSYQGMCGADLRRDLKLPEAGFDAQGYEFYGQVNFLKAGLIHSDLVTTVSPTYARELESPDFGWGLEGVLAARQERAIGILNGIDTEMWDPMTDPAVPSFTTRSLSGRRSACKSLLNAFSIDADRPGPLFAVVSRLTDQKGLDLLLGILPDMLRNGGSLVLLGSGDRRLEEAFQTAARDHEGSVGVRIGYDEDLAHRIYAGADAILVPSRFEPCGLTQMYAMRYGALPVVARTGGLADTIIDANSAAISAGVATGFQFEPGSREAFANAIAKVFAVFSEPGLWRQMQRNAMRHPVGWDGPAERYVDLYARLMAAKEGQRRFSATM
ncbi:glycogen synthase GlgA [Thalassobaculum sp. OXR-137]|uniref:glycogen synthase GlgA n=1 Tax=Thalassobaculum sp. OXR-137 TaxID=3100173 RepID=UPI002AC9CA62|nr:glycogen synthase GlgA [Thalassobaculum sp. OXR-137]WPZ33503.1 glycogen synthase GlgA [Thalassobaculum sp. OXR-137]